MGTYTTETIVINNPSEKMMELIEKIREHKRKTREATKNVEPLFVLHA